tara:strand:- start:56 stop:376 length:321 start_codon:yes stop_codon:yes gene_type:complete
MKTGVFKPHQPAPGEPYRCGHGHWLLYVVDNNSDDYLKYSCNDNDYWYTINKDSGKVYLYDVDLYVDWEASNNCHVIQLPVEAFAGVSGGSLKRTAGTYSNRTAEE